MFDLVDDLPNLLHKWEKVGGDLLEGNDLGFGGIDTESGGTVQHFQTMFPVIYLLLCLKIKPNCGVISK